MTIFETHAHYDDEAFDKDREELLDRLPREGIETVINVGASISSTKTTLELAEKYSYIYAAVGVHPSEVLDLEQEQESFSWLKKQCTLDKVLAVGEIGLDYHYPDPEPALQKKWFVKQLQMAREVKLPVIVHSREAAKDTLDILSEQMAGEIGGVIHCYSYSPDQVKDYLDMGFYFGIGGVVTFSNAKKVKEAVKLMPMNRILLETDSPYLAPAPNRGQRNSSLNLPYIIDEIAGLKGISGEEVMEITRNNARELFQMK